MALKITYVKCPENKYSIKCPYTMKPTGITVHNTANDASAMNEISYMLSNNNKVSYHYAVDDTRAVQGLALNRNAWHAGDGKEGTGNRNTIGIEICYSKSGGSKYDKAFDNSLTLVAQLMKQYKFTTKNVYYHKNWSGKNCPHRALANGITLTEYRKLVQARYDELYAPKPTTDNTKTYKVVKTINGYINASNAKNKKNAVSKVTAGTYYIYNEAQGMKNVTKKKGTPGSWINPSDNVVTKTTNSVVGKTLYLPATVNHWNVYPLSKSPTVGNECGALNPKKFGGLSYKILAQPQKDVVTISTYNYGKVNIYVGKDTPAVIK